MKLQTRRCLLASTILLGVSAFATPAFAQEEPGADSAQLGDPAERFCLDNPNDPQCAQSGQTILVTGSRIPTPTLTSVSPLQIVDAQSIDDSGVVNIQELLLENPVFGTPTLSRTNSNFLTSSSGVATVDLRNLGINRTLVLVNGRRFVAGVPSTAAVDLNTIPTQFIERVDILTGGASSIYGSDAVAGVVNIIYKSGFQGIEASGQIGISERGDDLRRQANLLMGSNFADDRGNVMVYLGYSNEGAVYSRDRRRSNLDQISCIFFSGADEDVFTPCRPFYSGFAPQGTFFFGDSNPAVPGNQQFVRTFDSSGNLITTNTNCVSGVPFVPIPGCNPTGFNRTAFRTIAVPTERYLMALRGNYEVTSGINVFVEGTFAQTKTTSELEPFPLGSADIFPATGGRVPIETLVNGVAVRNPFVPDFIYDNANDQDGDGLRDLYFTRRMSDFGNRGATAERNTFRFLAGLEGDLFDNWRWDTYFAYGQTTEAQVSNGLVNTLNFRNALAVITDAFGNPICADAQAREQGCAPANIFGANTLSPDAVRYIQAPALRNTLTRQTLVGANLAGDLVQLWGGNALGVAIGTEYRKEYSREDNDALTQAGLNAGNAIPSSEGQFDVIEGYAEVVLPLLTDQPFFDLLQLRGAVRVSDYSTVGTTWSYNGGVEWAPVRDIRFRGTYARAIRAPNIGELFTPPSQTFPPGLIDPCLGIGPTGGGALGDRCRAQPGVNANIAANGVFTLTQADLQGIQGFNRGNPDLFEETADSWTLGVVISPRSINFLRNFTLTVDYYNIEIEDAITLVGRQTIINQCFLEGRDEFCQFITRRPAAVGPNSAGSLDRIDSAGINAAAFKHEGIDAVLNYRQNIGSWGLGLNGNLSAQIAYTRILNAYFIPLPDVARDDFNREIGTSRTRWTASLAYDQDDWGFTVRDTYIGAAYLNNTFTGVDAGAEGSAPFRIPGEHVFDVQARFRAGDNYEFYLGVDNLFDNEPPPIITGLPGNDTGTETDAGTYDAIGRRFYAGARLRF